MSYFKFNCVTCLSAHGHAFNVAFSITAGIWICPCCTHAGFHEIGWHHQSHEAVFNSECTECHLAVVPVWARRSEINCMILLTNKWRSGRSWENYIRLWVPKVMQGVALVKDGQLWCLKNMIQGGLARWHLPQTTLLFVFPRASSKSFLGYSLTLWLGLTFSLEDVFAKSGRSLLIWLSVTSDLDLVFTELWLPSSLCHECCWKTLALTCHFLLYLLFAKRQFEPFSILQPAQIQWWVLSRIYTEVGSASFEWLFVWIFSGVIYEDLLLHTVCSNLKDNSSFGFLYLQNIPLCKLHGHSAQCDIKVVLMLIYELNILWLHVLTCDHVSLSYTVANTMQMR